MSSGFYKFTECHAYCMIFKIYIIILLSFVSAERIGFFTAPQESALGFWIGTEFSDNDIVDLDKDVESINISYITSSNFEINIERVVQFFDYDIDIYGNTFILPSVNYRNEISYYSLGLYYYFKSDLYEDIEEAIPWVLDDSPLINSPSENPLVPETTRVLRLESHVSTFPDIS